MAEEIINIATLTIDKTEANKSIVDTKQQIFELQKANAELRKDISKNGDVTGEQTKKFVENEQALKKLNAQYKTQSAAINDLTLAELKENKALTDSAKSRGQALAQTKELKTIRDQLNTSTEEGAQALALLNAKINQNDAYLKSNASAQEKASTISGNYRQALFGVDQALAQFGINGEQARTVVKGFGEGVTGAAKGVSDYTAKLVDGTRAQLGFKTSSQLATESQVVATVATEAQAVATVELAVAEEGAAVATDVATISLWGFATALAATGIGAVVILLVALISYVSKLDPVMDALEQVTAGVAAAFSALGKAIYNLDFSNLIGGMEEAYTAASRLKETQQELADLQRSQEVANAKASQQYDELILKSKNRTLTEQQRIAFLNKAQKIEEANFKQRAVLADAELNNAIEAARIKGELSEQEIANLRANTLAYGNYLLNTGKITEAQLEDIKKAELGKIEIQAESTKRLEKSRNAEDKLADDAAAKAKSDAEKAKSDAEKALQAEVKSQESEIALQRAKNAQLKQTDAERLEFLNYISKREIRLIEFKASKGLITEKEAQLSSLNIAKNQSAETLALAQKTIDEELAGQAKKFEDKKKLSEQDMIEEVSNAAFLRDIQVKRIGESTLLESEKALALTEIQQGYISNIELIEKNYEESKRQREELARQEAQTLADVSAEMRILALQEQGAAETEVQRLTLDLQLEQKKLALDLEYANEKRTAEEVRALKELEDKKYAVATKKIDEQVKAAKRATNLGMVKDSLAAASAIFGENKAIAVAMALVNTYEGISAGVKLGYPAAIPAVAAAAATGFAAVKNILKTDKSGGGSGGSSSSASSNTSTPASVFENPARTQTVATVNAAPPQDVPVTNVPVLVVADYEEVKGQQKIKIDSN